MRRLRALLFLLVGILGLRRRRDEPEEERIVAKAPAKPRAELAVVALLLGATACAVAFVVVFATVGMRNQTQWLGLALGGCFALLAAASIVSAEHLLPSDETEEDYGEREDPAAQQEVEQIVHESAEGITRKRLLGGTAGVAAGAVGAALLAPAVSLGPVFHTGSLRGTPWRRGRRLVDDQNRPLRADEIEGATFYTAYPEGADRDQLGAPVIVVRLDPAALRLPADRAGWAPQGIVAYSKVCTHAGCAVALYRKPLFPPTQPRPALICPCHYSTFDPAAAGEVIFGPAGRALPQLPLTIDRRGELRAGGNLSGPVGPAWWGVRSGKATGP